MKTIEILTENIFSKYYVTNVQIKDFNVLIDGKNIFYMPIKNDEETYEQIIEMGRNGNLLDYKYFSKHHKLIAIDLTKQTELENPDLKDKINFIGRLEKIEGATMFLIIEKSEETIFEFIQNAATDAWSWPCTKMETQEIANLLGDADNEPATTDTWSWPCIKMETQETANLLGDADNEPSEFVTKKWYVINDQINTVYRGGN